MNSEARVEREGKRERKIKVERNFDYLMIKTKCYSKYRFLSCNQDLIVLKY